MLYTGRSYHEIYKNLKGKIDDLEKINIYNLNLKNGKIKKYTNYYFRDLNLGNDFLASVIIIEFEKLKKINNITEMGLEELNNVFFKLLPENNFSLFSGKITRSEIENYINDIINIGSKKDMASISKYEKFLINKFENFINKLTHYHYKKEKMQQSLLNFFILFKFIITPIENLSIDDIEDFLDESNNIFRKEEVLKSGIDLIQVEEDKKEEFVSKEELFIFLNKAELFKLYAIEKIFNFLLLSKKKEREYIMKKNKNKDVKKYISKKFKFISTEICNTLENLYFDLEYSFLNLTPIFSIEGETIEELETAFSELETATLNEKNPDLIHIKKYELLLNTFYYFDNLSRVEAHYRLNFRKEFFKLEYYFKINRLGELEQNVKSSLKGTRAIGEKKIIEILDKCSDEKLKKNFIKSFSLFKRFENFNEFNPYHQGYCWFEKEELPIVLNLDRIKTPNYTHHYIENLIAFDYYRNDVKEKELCFNKIYFIVKNEENFFLKFLGKQGNKILFLEEQTIFTFELKDIQVYCIKSMTFKNPFEPKTFGIDIFGGDLEKPKEPYSDSDNLNMSEEIGGIENKNIEN